MAILDTELKAFQAASMPEDDASTAGGAISAAGIVEFTDIAATDTIEALSDGADTRTLTITGRLASGVINSEILTLNGTNVQTTSSSYERLLKAVLSAGSGTRTVTIRRSTGDTLIATLGLNITSTRRLFYNAASEAAQTIRYEKIFLKNTNSSLTLMSATVRLTADPGTAIRIGCAPSVDDTESVANRLTLPNTDVIFVDDGVDQTVPGGVIAAGSAIGVWAELTRGAAAAAIKNTFTVRLSGTST